MDDNNTFDAEEFKKPKLKSILINLLITLAVAAVAFYVTLPAINIHSKDFYGFVFLILAVYIVLSLLTAGKNSFSAPRSAIDVYKRQPQSSLLRTLGVDACYICRIKPSQCVKQPARLFLLIPGGAQSL